MGGGRFTGHQWVPQKMESNTGCDLCTIVGGPSPGTSTAFPSVPCEASVRHRRQGRGDYGDGGGTHISGIINRGGYGNYPGLRQPFRAPIRGPRVSTRSPTGPATSLRWGRLALGVPTTLEMVGCTRTPIGSPPPLRSTLTRVPARTGSTRMTTSTRPVTKLTRGIRRWALSRSIPAGLNLSFATDRCSSWRRRLITTRTSGWETAATATPSADSSVRTHDSRGPRRFAAARARLG